MMEDIANTIFAELGKNSGFQLAQVRFTKIQTENINYRMGMPYNSNRSLDEGVAIRVRANNAWGFAATFDQDKNAILETAKDSFKVAQASSRVGRKDLVKLADEPVHVDKYSVKIERDPFKVDFEEKAKLIEEANKRTFEGKTDVIKDAMSSYFARDVNANFYSSDGDKIEQRILMIGSNVSAVAVGPEGPQNRNLNINNTGGWEEVLKFNPLSSAETVQKEAIELALEAEKCPQNFTGTLILDPWQVGLQIHESCGHPTELDRVLGYEADLAGTSWMTTEKRNNLQYGNEMVNITQDPTISGILGHIKYDDEGVQARPVEIIKNGKFVGYQTDREHASLIGDGRSTGNSRADNYNDVPIIRMNCMYLEPPKDGFKVFEDLIADTKDAVVGIRWKSHSIDDKRLNFQFSCQMGYRVQNGEITKTLKNVSYQGITPEFWNSFSGGTQKLELHGHPNCGKGSPNMQTGYVTHGGPWSRFENVKIGII